MKTVLFDNYSNHTGSGFYSWRFIPDSALANAGKPFFIPDFADSFEATIAPAIRISRLGKSISHEFAHRYFSEIIPAVHFRSDSLLRELTEKGQPSDPAVSFDRSVIMSSPIDFETFKNQGTLILKKNGDVTSEWHLSDFPLCFGEMIEQVSAFNTMKTGDLIIPGISSPVKIRIGDTLELFISDSKLLRIDIK